VFLLDYEHSTNSTRRSGFNASDAPGFRCRSQIGVDSEFILDQQFFTGISSYNFTYLNSTADLDCDHRYFVILEACDSGGCIYSNTNGFTVDCGGNGDDDLAPWKAGLIAMGCALCCLLLLLLLLIVVVAKGKGDDKYTTTVHRNENVDKL